MEKYAHYEIERDELDPSGDYRDWVFRVINQRTGTKWQYRIAITGSALASTGMVEDLQVAVDTRGLSLVKKWLDQKKEHNVQGWVSTFGITSKSLVTTQQWLHWKEFMDSRDAHPAVRPSE